MDQFNRFKTISAISRELTNDERTKIVRWNLEPIKLLLDGGYRHILLQDEGAKSNELVSPGDSNHVFIKASLLERVEASVSVIEVKDQTLSSHNAIKLCLRAKDGHSSTPQSSITVKDIDDLIANFSKA
jgi:hypothetical protein